MFSTVALIATCLITPYQLAFYSHFKHKKEELEILDNLNGFIDFIFFIDIIISFNTTYFDKNTSSFSTSRKAIACNYMKTWFCIDFAAIFPFEKILDFFLMQSTEATEFTKIAKLARFYRAIKLFRLVKMSKLAKEKAKIKQSMQTKMHLSVAFERLLLFFAICLIFVHTLSCAWIWLAYENEVQYISNWIEANGFDGYDNYDLYITAVYFTVTTITTIGYGDICATETLERMLGILTMLIGVIAFSFSTGSLASII